MKVINIKGNKKQSGRYNATFCINEVRKASKISPFDQIAKKSLKNKRRINVCVSVYKLFTRPFINTKHHGNEFIYKCTYTLLRSEYICSFVSRYGKQIHSHKVYFRNFSLLIQRRFFIYSKCIHFRF